MTAERFFYVTALAGRHLYEVAGPYPDFDTALARLDPVEKYATKHDWLAGFMAWGVVERPDRRRTPLGEWSPTPDGKG